MVNQQPWLSVVMPTWNGAQFLRSTLDSIALQAEDNLEVIAVDDGSSDATIKILESYEHVLRLRIVKRQHTGNWVANTNIGLSMADGVFISLLHQDDCWLPGRVRTLRRMADKNPELGVFLHPAHFIDTAGKKIGFWKTPLPKNLKPVMPAQIFPKLLVQNFITVSAPCFRREIAATIGRLDERLWYTADWKLWLHIASSFPCIYYPHPLSAFRIHPASLTVKGAADPVEFHRQMELVVKEFLPLLAKHSGNEDRVKRLADLSLTVNILLADMASGRPIEWGTLLRQLLTLSPLSWWRYIKYSRILERSMARVRAGLLSIP